MRTGKERRFSHIRRALVVGLALAPLVFGGVASCIVADPPAALPTYSEQPPVIYGSSATPPAPVITTGAPASDILQFTVPVQLYEPTNFYVFQDYNTPNSMYLQPLPPKTPGADGGGLAFISFSW